MVGSTLHHHFKFQTSIIGSINSIFTKCSLRGNGVGEYGTGSPESEVNWFKSTNRPLVILSFTLKAWYLPNEMIQCQHRFLSAFVWECYLKSDITPLNAQISQWPCHPGGHVGCWWRDLTQGTDSCHGQLTPRIHTQRPECGTPHSRVQINHLYTGDGEIASQVVVLWALKPNTSCSIHKTGSFFFTHLFAKSVCG